MPRERETPCITYAELVTETDKLRAGLVEAEAERDALRGMEDLYKLEWKRAETAEARVQLLKQEVAWRQAQIEGRLR